MRLYTNMRIHLQSDTSTGDFGDLLLFVGDGAFPLADHPDVITVPTTIEIQPQSLEELIRVCICKLKSMRGTASGWVSEPFLLH